MARTRVDLPDGHFAMLRDPDEIGLEERDRIALAYDEQQGLVAARLEVARRGAAVFVEEWDLATADGKQLPLPRNDITVLKRVSIRTYDALIGAVEPLMERLWVHTEPTKEAIQDPESPFGSSKSSGSTSAAEKVARGLPLTGARTS
ncbi:MAG: hypothetical protein ACRDL8_07795 [Solirubrobacteraceae bacterium]